MTQSPWKSDDPFPVNQDPDEEAQSEILTDELREFLKLQAKTGRFHSHHVLGALITITSEFLGRLAAHQPMTHEECMKRISLTTAAMEVLAKAHFNIEKERRK